MSPDPADQAPVTFTRDIGPLLSQYREEMMWRIDLSNYEQVKANRVLIQTRLHSTDDPMPPKPFGPWSSDQVALFDRWIEDGCLE